MLIKGKVQSKLQKLNLLLGDRKARKIAESYQLADGYKRIYLFHIRKTGGTSLNYMFLSLGGEDGQEVYKMVCQKRRILINGKLFVGWNKHQIKKGNYYYGFSHLPFHQITLPEKTFTITCLRDPTKRIVSLYKMLTYYRDNNIPHPGMKKQQHWLGKSFENFLEKLPQEELLNQLYMFSSSFDVKEAFTNITNLSHFFFTEEFDQGVAELSSKLNLSLNPIHTRKNSQKLDISPNTMKLLEEKLAPEFELYNQLKEYKKTT